MSTASTHADYMSIFPYFIDASSTAEPGQRLVFARNTRYWRKDEAGVQLPYLDPLTLEIVADQNAEMLRLETGEVDFISTGIRAEDVRSVSRAADDGQVQLFHLGVGLDGLDRNRPAAPEVSTGAPQWTR